MTRKNLVIGAVRGYTFEELRPFVVSLRRTAFKGDLVLLWTSLSPATLAALKEHGVQLVHFPYRGNAALNSWSRFWPWLRPVVRLPVGQVFRHFLYGKILNFAFVRYLHFLHFLEARRGQYGNILFTDVRDVIFQDDPFRMPLPGNFVAFLEWPGVKFGHDMYFNDKWLLENYGPEMAARLKDVRISCCGTVMGTEAGMREYLKAFLAEIPQLKSVAHGADTSIHNILLRYHLANHVAIAENLEHAVATIGDMPGLMLDACGRVPGPNGLPVPVLHQYDRQLPRFARLLRELGVSEKA